MIKVIFLLALLALCSCVSKQPVPRPAPKIDIAATLRSKMTVITEGGPLNPIPDQPVVNQGYYIPLHFGTNAHAAFGWALEASRDLTNWFVIEYPILEDTPTVYATEPKMFYRVVGRN